MIHGIIAGQFTEAISVEIVEAATAVAVTATGNIVFATLVDEPANARDLIDAYLGEIMLEAASAAATVDAGLAYAAAILEQTTATEAVDGAIPGSLTATVAETVTAADQVDGTVVSAAVGRSAMLPDAFVNPSTSREANVAGTMVNL